MGEYMEKKKTEPKAKKSAAPKIVWKHNREYRHDLFKLKLAQFKKNTSFKKFTPNIVSVDHNHFFHSHDRKGRENEYCSAVGGHFHKVIKNEDGSIEFGVALRKVKKPMRDGSFRPVIEPVHYATNDPERSIADNHIHETEYLHSESLNLNQTGDPATQKAVAEAMKGAIPPTPSQISNTALDEKGNVIATMSEK